MKQLGIVDDNPTGIYQLKFGLLSQTSQTKLRPLWRAFICIFRKDRVVQVLLQNPHS